MTKTSLKIGDTSDVDQEINPDEHQTSKATL